MQNALEIERSEKMESLNQVLDAIPSGGRILSGPLASYPIHDLFNVPEDQND